MATFRQLRPWVAPRGVFHWLNALCILALLQLGFIMMFREFLGFDSVESKIALKYLHSAIGFIFLGNLLIRGSRGIIQKPRTQRTLSANRLGHYLRALFTRSRPTMSTTRPASRFVTIAMFALFTVSSITGLMRASTDLYLPPLGPFVARWVAESPEKASQLDPRSKAFLDERRLNILNQIKLPIGRVHQLSAWALVVLIVLHIVLASDMSTSRRGQADDLTDPPPP